jgi:hypothetical protein
LPAVEDGLSVTFPEYYPMPLDNPGRPLSILSASELRNRASDYRKMAATARPTAAYAGLLELADHFDAIADERQKTVGG